MTHYPCDLTVSGTAAARRSLCLPLSSLARCLITLQSSVAVDLEIGRGADASMIAAVIEVLKAAR